MLSLRSRCRRFVAWMFVLGLAAPLGARPDDCNGNGVDDALELGDCDGNGVLDECEPHLDANGNGVPDVCEGDCNRNGVVDIIELLLGLAADCDGNGLLDACDIAAGAADCNANGILDVCEQATGSVGIVAEFGTGLAGAGGFVPALAVAGCPAIGFGISLEVSAGAGGAFGVLFFAADTNALPFQGGTLYLGAPIVASEPHVLSGAGPGAGTHSSPFQINDASLAGLTIHAQAGYLDAAAVAGISLTPAVSVTFPTP